jgi:AcrR family transcriptional regulator
MIEATLTKGERTRQAIEAAAYDLFMEQGFHATSMRQIADRAGLALGGLYNHFGSKEEMFRAILTDRHPYKQILPLIQSAEGETVEEFVRNAARGIIRELGRRPDFLKLMFIELVEFNGKHVHLIVREIVPRVLPVFERVMAHRKSVRHIHPAVLMRAFIGTVFSFYVTEMFIGSALGKLMPGNTFESIVDIYLHGILKEPA